MRPGKPVHISEVLGTAVNPNTIAQAEPDGDDGAGNLVPVHFKIDIPRRRSVVDTVAQDLAGPNWNGGPILSGRRQSKTGRGGQTSRFTIRNTTASGGESMQISFDRGNSFFTLDPGEAFTWEINISYFIVRPSNGDDVAATPAGPRTGDITFEALAVVH